MAHYLKKIALLAALLGLGLLLGWASHELLRLITTSSTWDTLKMENCRPILLIWGDMVVFVVYTLVKGYRIYGWDRVE